MLFLVREQNMLKPADIAVLLYLYLHPRETYAHMAATLGVSTSTCHAAVGRLLRSGLVHRTGRDDRKVAVAPMLEFLQFGVPYAFPPETVSRARGIPTGIAAYSAARHSTVADEVHAVWPSPLGRATGTGVRPLVPGAPNTATLDPALYDLLVLVDALRLGDARERDTARGELRRAMEPASPMSVPASAAPPPRYFAPPNPIRG